MRVSADLPTQQVKGRRETASTGMPCGRCRVWTELSFGLGFGWVAGHDPLPSRLRRSQDHAPAGRFSGLRIILLGPPSQPPFDSQWLPRTSVTGTGVRVDRSSPLTAAPPRRNLTAFPSSPFGNSSSEFTRAPAVECQRVLYQSAAALSRKKQPQISQMDTDYSVLICVHR